MLVFRTMLVVVTNQSQISLTYCILNLFFLTQGPKQLFCWCGWVLTHRVCQGPMLMETLISLTFIICLSSLLWTLALSRSRKSMQHVSIRKEIYVDQVCSSACPSHDIPITTFNLREAGKSNLAVFSGRRENGFDKQPQQSLLQCFEQIGICSSYV